MTEPMTMTLYVITREQSKPFTRKDYRDISRLRVDGEWVYLYPMVGDEVRINLHVFEVSVFTST